MDLAYEDDVVDLTGATESPPRPLAPVSAKREAGTASGAPAKKKPKAAPAATTKTGRRRERQKRNADVRSGLKPLPTPIVDFDAEAARGMLTLTREGVPVHLPRARPPYRSQLQVMDGAIRAVRAARSALLESPTGTGKTLAALAAVLAWQRQHAHDTPTRVVWVARTHDQLQHAVHEYKRSCPYRPLMSLRLSRERFCLHPNIATAPNKAEACEEATKIRKPSTKKSKGCAHLDKAERIGYPQGKKWRPHFRLGGPMVVWDIEDAVKEGKATHVCPFHMAQDQIQEGAALIFITYSQLVDPVIRRAGGLDAVLEDAVVVVDEGHNLPSVARDAASYEVTEDRLADMVKTLEEFAPHLGEYPEAQAMLESLIAPPPGSFEAVQARLDAPPPTKRKKKPKLRFRVTARGGPLRSLLAWLRGATAPTCAAAPLGAPATRKRDAFKDEEERIWRGADAATLVRDVLGLENAERVDEHCKMLWKMRKDLIDEGLESGAVRSDTINDLEAILVKLRYLLDPAAATRYKLIATSAPRRDVFPKGSTRAARDARNAMTDAQRRRRVLGCDGERRRAISFLCLEGSVAMETLTRGQRAAGLGQAEWRRPCRSLLLLSGTLRPFDLLARELGFELGAWDRTDLPPPALPPSSAPAVKDENAAPDAGAPEPKPLSQAYAAHAVAACHLPTLAPAPGRPAALTALQLARAAGTELDGSYANATKDPESTTSRRYYDAVATALLGVAAATPGGVLVFFKSYQLLELATARWETTGGRARLEAEKRGNVFVEVRRQSGDEFDALVGAYRAAAATPAGAMLLAVMRGRSAEGADFKDDAARCVVIVGVPYPPRFDAATRLKIEHAGRDGETWYKAEAYRNVNQAAGRLIRHSKDYGALVLLDRALHKHPMMSEWFAERIERPSGATELHHRLRSFFSARDPLVID